MEGSGGGPPETGDAPRIRIAAPFYTPRSVDGVIPRAGPDRPPGRCEFPPTGLLGKARIGHPRDRGPRKDLGIDMSHAADGRVLIRWLTVVVALALSVAACGGGDAPDDAGSGTQDGDPDGTGDGGDAGSVGDVRLAAPGDCVVNPFCAPGLRRVYGVDARAALLPLDPDQVVEAVLRGDATLGVVFSADPALALEREPSLVVLEDDLGMHGAENVVPLIRRPAIDRLGSSIVAALDAISAQLETADLARVLDAAADERDGAIATWVSEHGPFGDGEGTVTLGAQSFTENRVVTEIYAASLASAGYDASVFDVEGFRPYAVDALVFGDVDVIIDYAASSLEFLSGYQGVATADTGETIELLARFADYRDIDVLAPSPAASANEFVMESATAAALGVSRLSQLDLILPSAPPDVDDDDTLLSIGSGPDDLGVGFVGERVVALEVRLLELGYDPGPADGVFDQETRVAVVALQQCRGLVPDGVVGPATQESLDTDDSPPCDLDDGADFSPGPGPDGDDPVVYFTFDDGPHPTYTPQILDVLAQYDAAATFWNIGQQVGPNTALAQRMISEGHVVGNHTWSHPDLTKVDRTQFFAEIDSTDEAILLATGRQPTCLRPPYGARNSTVDAEAAEAGLDIVLWDIDPQDWRRPGVDAIVDNVLSFAAPGSIVLMHDGGGVRDETVAALSRVLAGLSERGYRFEALPCN